MNFKEIPNFEINNSKSKNGHYFDNYSDYILRLIDDVKVTSPSVFYNSLKCRLIISGHNDQIKIKSHRRIKILQAVYRFLLRTPAATLAVKVKHLLFQ